MSEQESMENRLKRLLEDMGERDPALVFRAQTTLSLYKQAYEGLSYDEAIKTIAEQDKIVEACGPFDPAFSAMASRRNDLLKWATALNDKDEMGRHDHEIKTECILALGNLLIECVVYIPRLFYHPSRRAEIIATTVRAKIYRSAEWRGSYRELSKFEIVEQ